MVVLLRHGFFWDLLVAIIFSCNFWGVVTFGSLWYDKLSNKKEHCFFFRQAMLNCFQPNNVTGNVMTYKLS